MGILGLEKSKKRHPNSFQTRQIAIKPPTILLSNLLSPPHFPLPPRPAKKEKQLTTTKSALLKNSSAIVLCHSKLKEVLKTSLVYSVRVSVSKFPPRQRTLTPITLRARSLTVKPPSLDTGPPCC